VGIATKMIRAGLITATRKALRTQRPHVLIACTPKSASSFLARAFEALPGVTRLRASQPGYRQDMVLDPIQLGRHEFDTYVIKRHVRYNRATERAIADFSMTPVVLTRDLADSVASMRDFIKAGNFRIPMAWFDERHMQMDDSDLDLMIVDLVMPWYLNFLAGWHNCENAIWFGFDEVREQPVRVMREISAAAGLAMSDEAFETAVDVATNRKPAFNRGVPGRGQRIAPDALERLKKLLDHYPELAAEQRAAHPLLASA
jgi:hypothetical protein